MQHTASAFFLIIIASTIVPADARSGISFNDAHNTVDHFKLNSFPAAVRSITFEGGNFEPAYTAPFSIFESKTPPPAPMTGQERLHYFLKRTFGLEPMLRSAVSAGIKQARDTVPEWGQGMEGYSFRFGSSVSRRIIKNSIHHGIGSLLNEDPRYYPSGRTGIWPRSLYAAGQTFVTHKDTGEARFAYSRVLGTVSSICISRAWYPERKQNLAEYFSATAISLGFETAKNIVREFWPDIKRRFGRKN